MIRNLEKQDREKILKILCDTGNFNDGEIEIAMELIDVYLNKPEQKDYEIFVDENENQIRGYICIGQRPLTEGTFDLYWIAVNPEIQSKGVGSGLVKYIEEFIKSLTGRIILIETSGKESYEKERKFYEKNGYDLHYTIKDFYRPGDDLVVYSKYL
ncbi:MAG TPA: GNAT family N-acetyltransferase [Ignavibacteria bacterium]|nr:GNAT family N-acetyltransferase [Ignavibacteria bacterium]